MNRVGFRSLICAFDLGMRRSTSSRSETRRQCLKSGYRGWAQAADSPVWGRMGAYSRERSSVGRLSPPLPSGLLRLFLGLAQIFVAQFAFVELAIRLARQLRAEIEQLGHLDLGEAGGEEIA